jgi:hypothetical protein
MSSTITQPDCDIIQLPREGWVRKPDLCKHFGVSARTIERWMTAGMPYRKGIPGKSVQQDSVRFRLSDCEVWLQK